MMTTEEKATVMGWIFENRQFGQQVELEWPDSGDANFEEFLKHHGFTSHPEMEMGNPDVASAVLVHASEENSNWSYFATFITTAGSVKHILVETFPDLIELLSKLAPIATGTLETHKYDESIDDRY